MRIGSLGRLGEALYVGGGSPCLTTIRDARRIHHVRQDIGFHVTGLLERCRPAQIEAVLMKVTLDADIERVFGIRSRHRENDYSGMDGEKLSARCAQTSCGSSAATTRPWRASKRGGKIDWEVCLKAAS